MKCPKCNSTQESSSHYCSNCGHKIISKNNTSFRMTCNVCEAEYSHETIYCLVDGSKLTKRKIKPDEYPFIEYSEEEAFSITKDLLEPYKDILQELPYELSNAMANDFYKYIFVCQVANKNPYHKTYRAAHIKFIEEFLTNSEDLIKTYPPDLKICSLIMLGRLLMIQNPGELMVFTLNRRIKKELKKSNDTPNLLEKIGLFSKEDIQWVKTVNKLPKV